MAQHSDSFSIKHSKLKIKIKEVANAVKKIDENEQKILDFILGKKNRAFFELIHKSNGNNYYLNLETGAHWIDAKTNKSKGYGLKHWLERHYGAGADSEISAKDILNFTKHFCNSRMMTDHEKEKYNTLKPKEGFIRTLGEFNYVIIISKHEKLPNNQWGSITYFKDKAQVLSDLS